MPTSVKRHNLARLRQELSLTQTDLAAMVNRKQATIKAIETGKLQLSENLATLIANVTGANKQWLLDNDLSAPMPEIKRLAANWPPEDKAYGCTFLLLLELFSRLFAVARRLQDGPNRKIIPIFIEDQIRILEEAGYEPDAVQTQRASVGVFEFFKANPQLLDPDLGRLINLDYLCKDAYQAERVGKRVMRKEAKEPDQLMKPHGFSFSASGETRSRKPRLKSTRARPLS